MASRQRRQVLKEEDYQDNLTTIIQRDYFPDVPALQRDVALQERRAAGDFPGAVMVRRAARALQQHEEHLVQTEQQQEEAAAAGASDGGVSLRQVPRPLHRETLTGFHARVTSQDNAEFEQVQNEELREQRKEWLLALTNGPATSQKQNDAAPQLRHALVPSPLPLASDQFQPPSSAAALPPSSNAETENSLFFVPEARQKLETESPATLLLENGTTSEEQQRALLSMPPPAAKKTTTSNPPTTSSLVEYVPKARLVKKIEPSATRFPKPQQQQQQLVRHRQQHWDVDSDTTATSDAYATDSSGSSSAWTTDLDAPPTVPLNVEQRQGRKRARREQETLVQMTPLIVPGQGGRRGDAGAGAASPIVTWGSVGATPVVLGAGRQGHGSQQPESPNTAKMDASSSSSSTVGRTVEESSFQMPVESDRDVAAAKAQAKMAQRLRRAKQARTSGSSSSLRSQQLDPRTSLLSPAARALLSKSASSALASRPLSARSASSFGSALRSSYNRSASSSAARASSSSSRHRDTAYNATPRVAGK